MFADIIRGANGRHSFEAGTRKIGAHRHPWVFSGAIARVQGAPQPGEIVEVRDHADQFLARGYYNPHSQIAVRLLTWDAAEEITPVFWRRRLQAAVARRAALIQDPATTACRLLFAESDGLPGLSWIAMAIGWCSRR